MDHDEAVTRLLDAAEALFYDRGVQAVGMDAVRERAGVSLKRLYQCFPSKEALVVAYLRRRDTRWRGRLAAHVEARPEAPVAAVFDWLGSWFAEPDFRGCAFINSFGELGATSPAVAEVVREHKLLLKDYLATLSPRHAETLYLLVEGAIVTAAITDGPAAAERAGTAAALLVRTAGAAAT